ncbi:hypothetical protein ACRAWD_29355 [Caulobacter segnis]
MALFFLLVGLGDQARGTGRTTVAARRRAAAGRGGAGRRGAAGRDLPGLSTPATRTASPAGRSPRPPTSLSRWASLALLGPRVPTGLKVLPDRYRHHGRPGGHRDHRACSTPPS